MSRTLNLNAMAHFEAVARRGTITLAAEELSVSASAVSQQIKQLEQRLGLRLFRRDGRRLSLTLEGQQLFQTASAALGMLREVQGNLAQTREARRLNLRVTPGFGVRWLGPRLHDFITRNPDWDLRVDAAPDPTNFDREIMDLDIRYGSNLPGRGETGLEHRAVVQDDVLPLCSPDYLGSLPKGADPARTLAAARLVDSARALCQWDAWFHHTGISVARPRRAVLMDRSTMALQLAMDHAGVVLESLALAADLVAEGRLVPVIPTAPVLRFPAYWAVCPARHLKRRAVSRFLDWLDTQAADHRAALSLIFKDHDLRVTSITPQDARAALQG